jgi:polysaccharide export outer membrane protein
MTGTRRAGLWAILGCALAVGAGGCLHAHQGVPVFPDLPAERSKTVLGDYLIEPPDLLEIDLVSAIPLPPYRIQPLDVLLINVENTPKDDPIAGLYSVDPDGTVNLGGVGGRYGSIKVVGLSAPEARDVIEKYLRNESPGKVKNAVVILGVAQGRGAQLVRGQHLVRPDGTVDLGSYGTVRVAGRTVPEAKRLIEAELSTHLQSPEVLVSVIGYNSKVYYVIFGYGGAGQQIVRMPVMGSETVLDAVSQLGGLSSVSDPRRVWVARSAGPGEPDKIMPVDWCGVTRRGRGETNYQLLPGDRIYVEAYPMVAVDVAIARVTAPVERLFGFTLLGATTYQGVKNAGNSNGNGTLGP